MHEWIRFLVTTRTRGMHVSCVSPVCIEFLTFPSFAFDTTNYPDNDAVLSIFMNIPTKKGFGSGYFNRILCDT